MINKQSTSATLADSKYCTAFLILEYTFLPSSTAAIIVAKLSSASTISAAPLLTSVPVIPIPIPMSAVLIDGASFTPSPVIATITLKVLYAFTILTLFSGLTLAKTLYDLRSLKNSSSVSLSSSAPVMALSPFLNIPICVAIATAVSRWSPVIIIGVIPAFLQVATAPSTSFLGGSIIPTSPTKTKSSSSLSCSFR